MPERCRYDDSLPWLVDVLVADIGLERVAAGVALCDASGRLTFFVDAKMGKAEQESTTARLRSRLGGYARPDRVLADCEAPGARSILDDPDARRVDLGTVSVRYLDRRVVGADWLRAPLPVQERPQRCAFSSLKGGVGRSTALSVVAADQARRGRNVLVVDLDLEAPGIGSMLLSRDRRPPYGALDYLVERNLGPVGPEELDAFVGTSGLTSGAGVVDVVPVVGTRSDDTPGNYLSKLARAMLEELEGSGAPKSVVGKTADMLTALEARRNYHLVLIDARAGLAELAAGPLLGLGANVLLFGAWQPQTVEGLRFLFAHLASLAAEGQGSPWQALKMVHAKALRAEDVERFQEELWELFQDYLYEEAAGLDAFNFDAAAPEAPHNPIPILLDPAFADWNPATEPSKLVVDYYDRTFGALLRYVDEALMREEP